MHAWIWQHALKKNQYTQKPVITTPAITIGMQGNIVRYVAAECERHTVYLCICSVLMSAEKGKREEK